MTTITANKRDGVYGVEVSGHAGYGPQGADIVCAGISGACYVVAELVHSLSAAGLGSDASVQADDGLFTVSVRPAAGPAGRMAAECMVTAFMAAGRRLQAQYPDHVQVIGGAPDGR